MKYSVYTIILSVLLIASSCSKLVRTYEIDDYDDINVLVMNSQMDAGSDNHSIYLNQFNRSEVKTAYNPVFDVKVNGNSVHSGAASEFDYRFKPGDRVVVESVCHEKRLISEVTVPQPPEILSHEQFFTDKIITLYFTLKDRPGEKNWYRLFGEIEESYDYEDYTGKIIHENRRERLIFDSTVDPIITSGFSREGDDIFSDLMPENKYAIFSDKDFADDSARLKVDIDRQVIDHYYEYGKSLQKYNSEVSNYQVKVYLKVYSISEDQYRYLKAATSLEYNDFDLNFLVEPVLLPSNVSGGLGMVAIDMPTYVEYENIFDYRND